MENLSDYMEIISGVIGFLLGCGVTLTVQKIRQGNNSNYSDQRNSKVGGDQAGRDINKS